MHTLFEKPATRPATPGAWLADSGGHYALSALVGFLFACTGPVAIILATGTRGGLSNPAGVTHDFALVGNGSVGNLVGLQHKAWSALSD